MSSLIPSSDQPLPNGGYDRRNIAIFGLVTAILNFLVGILIVLASYPFVNRSGVFLSVMPFILSGVFLVGVWIARRGFTKAAFDLIFSIFLLQMLIFGLATQGYGLILGIASFIFGSAIAIEIAPQERINRIMFLAGVFGTTEFILDYYGPQNRIQASGLLQQILPYVVTLAAIVYIGLLVRQFNRMSLLTKIIIPVVIISYLSIGALTAFNYYSSLNMINSMSPVSSPQASAETNKLLTVLENQVRSNALLAVLISVLVTFAFSMIIRFITNPIRNITEMAHKATTGKFNMHLKVTSQDEIGTLAQALNIMTSQLRQMLGTLEQRVEIRTHELALASQQARARAEDLEKVSEITRTFASIRDLDVLLPLITHTISDQLGYYHIAIYLVDLRHEYAVLRATNSEGGERMLNRGHRVQVGHGTVIGAVLDRGEPQVASDSGNESVFINNPDLPHTRSQVGLPLKAGGQILGALDVQSTDPNAFSKEAVAQLSILADQVGITIENARLFSETLRTVAELQSLQREYIHEEWFHQVKERQQAGYQYTYGVVTPLTSGVQAESAKIWEFLDKEGMLMISPNPVTANQETIPLSRRKHKGSASSLTVPISLRGEIIGLIKLEEIDLGRLWAEDEISLVKAVADQVGLALENARLLEETQRRAQREATVSQITSRLRASNDPNTILQTAIIELRQALHTRTAQIVFPQQDTDAQTENEAGDQQGSADD